VRNWIERYVAGETETVWAEMVACGPAIRTAEVPSLVVSAVALVRR